MSAKRLPFTKEILEEIIKTYPTPFHIYDERGILEAAASLKKAFTWNKGFKEFFPVKATPNPYILKILKNEGFGADCSSLTELILAEKTGIDGEEIMFTSNDTAPEEFVKAKELGAVINLDDISHIRHLEEFAGIPDIICFRYNPGSVAQNDRIIGNSIDSKFGSTKEQLYEGYRKCRDMGIRRFGIHTMVVSNELNPGFIINTAKMLFEVIAGVSKELEIRFEFVNLGGGVGIPYKPKESPVDIEYIGKGIKDHYTGIIERNGLTPLKIFMECGRFITGPNGYLVSRVLHIKKTYKNYAGLDASMANLMRPGMYGAYHHISVPGKETGLTEMVYDVTGSLCENADKLAVDRIMPELEEGDIVVIHDTGAHGHSMGYNYNGKLRSAELLLRGNGVVKLIRRAETVEDHFATLDFSNDFA
ncbi:diaminopimelate decarboxylase [candidate division KSB1 bacterium]